MTFFPQKSKLTHRLMLCSILGIVAATILGCSTNKHATTPSLDKDSSSINVNEQFLLDKNIFPNYTYELLSGEDFFKEINDFTPVPDNTSVTPQQCRDYVNKVADSIQPYVARGNISGISVKAANPQVKKYFYEAVIGGPINIDTIEQSLSGPCAQIKYVINNDKFDFVIHSTVTNTIAKNTLATSYQGLDFLRHTVANSMKKDTHSVSTLSMKILNHTAIIPTNHGTIIFLEKSLGTYDDPEPIDNTQFSDLLKKAIDQVLKQG